MTITDIVKIDKKKSFVYIDYEKAFALYAGEIRKYNLKIDEEIKDEDYNEIVNEVLPKRCKERALYILKDSDKSERDIYNKLTQGGYPSYIVEKVIEKLSEYHYIDDMRYARNYVKFNISAKSHNRIVSELYSKGIDKEIIEQAFENDENNEESILNIQYNIIEKEFIKKHYDFQNDDKKLLNKVIASIMRKGFKYDDIMHVYNIKKEDLLK